ncbi:WXG100 family type VII secretion target [Nocardia carnea]|uniref:WXG100 family type VII secretion target n=1 Tax=Nocardia carnea TaxID=37328 RepID=UPI0024542687|nr:WXG100 family type VII secretion target [Nocardia carnea]
MNDKFEFLVTANEISPTYWACTWSKNVLGVDPVEWFAQKITGDWEALQKAGKAVENLAAYSSSFSDEIQKAAQAVDTTWDGNAATSAQTYFAELSTAVAAQVDSLNAIADEIKNFANAAYYGAKSIGDAVQTLLDLAAIAIIQWAAVKVSAATGVGAVATAALIAAATLSTIQVIKEFELIAAAFSSIYLGLEGIAGLIYAGVGAVQSGDLTALPQKPYDHPGA